MKIDLLAAIKMLPRFQRFGDSWNVDGKFSMTNGQRLPVASDKAIHKLMDSMLAHSFKPTVELVDVTGNDVWVLHRHLRFKNLVWLAKRDWSWQKWPREDLPTYIRYNGRLIIWNGTHRMTLCRLAGRKVRARIWDVTKFAEFKKTHPYGWNIKAVKPRAIRVFKRKRDAVAYVKAHAKAHTKKAGKRAH